MGDQTGPLPARAAEFVHRPKPDLASRSSSGFRPPGNCARWSNAIGRSNFVNLEVLEERRRRPNWFLYSLLCYDLWHKLFIERSISAASRALRMSLYQRTVRNVLYPLDRWRSGDGAELRSSGEFEKDAVLFGGGIAAVATHTAPTATGPRLPAVPLLPKAIRRRGRRPRRRETLADLRMLPVVEKRHIQEHRDAMAAANWPRRRSAAQSDGRLDRHTAIVFREPRPVLLAGGGHLAAQSLGGFRYRHAVGVPLGSGARRAPHAWKQRLRNLLIDRQIALDTGYITESKLPGVPRGGSSGSGREIIVAYANSVALLARFLRSRPEPAYRPRSIIATARGLGRFHPSVDRGGVRLPRFQPLWVPRGARDRQRVRNTTGCTSWPRDSTWKSCTAAAGAARRSGTVLVTDLLNLAMPLIRYQDRRHGRPWKTATALAAADCRGCGA